MERDLDGYYFRVQRNNKWVSICFTDLTDEEALEVIKNKSEDWLISLLKGLNDVGNKLLNESLSETERLFIKDKLNKSYPFSSFEDMIMDIRKNIIIIGDMFNIIGY